MVRTIAIIINIMKIKIFISTLLSSLLVASVFPVTSYAAGASISVTSSASSVANGGNLVIAVYMNGGGEPINAVQANISYSPSQLQYIGLNYSGSPFNIATPGDGGGNGSVSIQNGTISPVSGSALVATVTFRALVASGSTTIGVAGSSSLISANTNTAIPFSPGGVSVAFGAPVIHSSSLSPASGAAPGGVSTPVLPKTVITGVKANNLTPSSATITWTTNNPGDSIVDFGLDANYGLSNSSATTTTSHSVQLSGAFLLPQTRMYYKVQTTDSAGNVTSSPDMNFVLPGVPITIIVFGPNGNPQPNVQVTIDNSTGTTNSKGVVVLTTGYGAKKITSLYQGVSISKPINITPKTKPLTSYQLDLAKQPLNHWMVTALGLILLVFAMLIADAIIFKSKLFASLSGIGKLDPIHHHISSAEVNVASHKQAVKDEPLADEFNDDKIDLVDHGGELDGQIKEDVELDGLVDSTENQEISELIEPVQDEFFVGIENPKQEATAVSPVESVEPKSAPALTIKVTDFDDPLLARPPTTKSKTVGKKRSGAKKKV
jgi:hypothetical protein